MRILLDTNILIHLENTSEVLENSLARIIKICQEQNHKLLIHQASYDDINRDSDCKRRSINLSKLEKYMLLENPPTPVLNELVDLGIQSQNDNDKVDNNLLYSIYKDAADILITEDRAIHRNARKLGIPERVHYIQQTIDLFQKLYTKKRVALPNIEEQFLYNIDLDNNLFSSLKCDYGEFEHWYKKVSREGRKAWICRDDAGKVGAVCIYKEENSPIVTDNNNALPGGVLKLCTFKVGERNRGKKIGELFLKAAFRYASLNKCEYIYLTMNPIKQSYLEDLCIDFGFNYFGQYKNDKVYVKSHPIRPVHNDGCSTIEYHRLYFPHFRCDRDVKQYLIPIKPQFHEMLFPDNQAQASLPFQMHMGNAIKLAYLCHSRIQHMKPGDILLFYRSHDLKSITSIGIVEIAQHFQDVNKIIQLVSKRTVYSYSAINLIAKVKTLVILFRLAQHLIEPIPFRWLLDQEIVNGNIQSIRSISNDSFAKIIKKWGGDSCFNIN